LKTKGLLPIILLSLFFVATATAFHGKTELSCEKCHTMHYSSDVGVPMSDEGPFKHLVTMKRSTELCLTCHSGKAGIPDVVGEDDANGLTGRAAGFFAVINAPNANGHDLQADEISPSELCSTCHSGGNFRTAKIGCIDCHDPHGKEVDDTLNYSYRNLRSASNPDSGMIFRAFVKPGVTGLETYEQRNIGYTAPNTKVSKWREVTNICFDCHHTFNGESYTRNSSGVCIRHPSTDSERGIWEAIDRHGLPQTDPKHWENGTGIGFAMGRVPFIVSEATDYSRATSIATNGSRTTNEVFCLTCHKAHGSRYQNSLRWSIDSNLGCQQCHNKG